MTAFEQLRDELLAHRDVSEETPFGPEVLVYKVRGKVFAIVNWMATPIAVSLKCEPLRALELREEYVAVEPGYHLNKRHWNTVVMDGSIPDNVIRALIDDSWTLVARNLSKADRQALGLIER
jgi:predicted DNA-binding protein (MmcQ/YjbR family)